MKRALILVDIQNDFLPGGALPVEQGDEVVPVVNRMMEHFELVVATKDWHPANHGSFAANHPWRRPGQKIRLNGQEQILWPMHCVQESFGADFAPNLDEQRIDHIVYKGTDPEVDSYSGFFDNGRKRATGLADFLRGQRIERLFITGLATDYCVKYTALDALHLGFDTFVVADAVRGINQEPGDVDRALDDMRSRGARIVASGEAMAGVA